MISGKRGPPVKMPAHCAALLSSSVHGCKAILMGITRGHNVWVVLKDFIMLPRPYDNLLYFRYLSALRTLFLLKIEKNKYNYNSKIVRSACVHFKQIFYHLELCECRMVSVIVARECHASAHLHCSSRIAYASKTSLPTAPASDCTDLKCPSNWFHPPFPRNFPFHIWTRECRRSRTSAPHANWFD